MQHRTMTHRTALKVEHGFSLIEMIIALAVLMVMAGVFIPLTSNAILRIELRSSATDLSGVMQRARGEAARQNTYFSLAQTTLSSGETAYFVDLKKNGTFSTGEPVVQMANQVTVYFGTGSGAPGESAFAGGFNFTFAPSGVLPNFNARGLPCVVSGQACPLTPGQGFIYFLSRPSTFGTNWASVVVTPSGRVQVFSYDGANWTQV
jgi:prepilin-type N-terminal cleavage/methylation domain-containing protein